MSRVFFPRDEHFMRLALREAERALEHDDVPIGCVIVQEGEVLAAAGNERHVLVTLLPPANGAAVAAAVGAVILRAEDSHVQVVVVRQRIAGLVQERIGALHQRRFFAVRR